MTLKAEILFGKDLTEEEKDNYFFGMVDDLEDFLKITYNGEVIDIYSSKIEPEDCSFHRDLAFVKNLVEDAYKRGISWRDTHD